MKEPAAPNAVTFEEYLQLANRINRLDKAYYRDNTSGIPDHEYDRLRADLEQIEAEHPDYLAANPGSPSRKPAGVNSKSLKAYHHPTRLLSLQDFFDFESLEAWYRNINAPAVSVEEKIDGLTCALYYVNNWLEAAATRGEGGLDGELVTENALRIAGIPQCLPEIPGVDPENNKIAVRVEVYQPVSKFLAINEAREAEGLDPYANPRNCASGGLRTSDPEETRRRGLAAFAFQIISAEGWESQRQQKRYSQAGDLELLASLGFTPVRSYPALDFSEIKSAIETIAGNKSGNDYWTDGAVVKTASISLQNELGAGDKYPVHSAAYKYPAEEKPAEILDITVQTGRTGRLTPVASITPVQIGGTTVSRVTLHNQKYLDDNMIDAGAGVRVIKSGEIIPKIAHVDKPAVRPFRIESCPVCGAHAVREYNSDGDWTGSMVCPNKTGCQAQALRYLEFFCSKPVMDIRNMGPEMIKALWDAGLVKSVPDIYDLPGKLDEIAKLPRCGVKKARNLAAAIEKSKSNDIDRLIKSLGIPGVGRHIGRALARKCAGIAEVRGLSDELLMSVEGIGEITIRDIRAFWNRPENVAFVQALADKGVNMKSLSYRPPEENRTGNDQGRLPLEGMSFVVTGTIEGFTRGDVEDYIRQHGGTPSGSVSKRTTYLVAGANAGSKLKKAQDLGIAVLSVQDLKELCGEA